jgi:membrane protease YdiL (CAAX protease family)
MTRHVVLVGHDASLATTIQSLLDPDDRLAEVGGVDGWKHLPDDRVDVVVVDLPSEVRLQAVEEVRRTYDGPVIVLEPAQDRVAVPREYRCPVIERPDSWVLWKLAAAGEELASASSKVAEVSAELAGSGGHSTERSGILLQTISAQRPGPSDRSKADEPLEAFPDQGHDHGLPHSIARQVAQRLRADVVVVLLDNGEGQMDVAGGVGLTPAERRLRVDYSHDVMRDLFHGSISLINDNDPLSGTLDGVPGSQAQTLVMAMLVHDHSWLGVLIAGRSRSQTGIPTEAFTNTDIRTFIAVAHEATPSLHAVSVLRRLEWLLREGLQGTPAQPGPTTGAEASPATQATQVAFPLSPSDPDPALPVPTARRNTSTQDAPAEAQSGRAVDTAPNRSVRAGAMLLAYLSALTAIELAGSWPLVSVPVAAASHGVLALLVCVALRLLPGQGVAVLLPPLVATSVVRLVTLAALPGNVTPLARLMVVGVPALVAIAIAARLRAPGWRFLPPHTGGWPGQLLVTLVGIPLALILWAIAPPAVELAANTPAVVAATALIIFAALPEEMLYRGLLVPAASAAVGPWGVLLASVGYAVAYIPSGSTTTLGFAFLLGMVLGWCRQRTGSVVGVIGAHSVLNVMVYLLLPALG